MAYNITPPHSEWNSGPFTLCQSVAKHNGAPNTEAIRDIFAGSNQFQRVLNYNNYKTVSQEVSVDLVKMYIDIFDNCV